MMYVVHVEPAGAIKVEPIEHVLACVQVLDLQLAHPYQQRQAELVLRHVRQRVREAK